MKIEEVRKNLSDISPHNSYYLSGDAQGDMCFEVEERLIKISFWDGVAPETFSRFKDNQMVSLRDWLCELYGLPEKNETI